MASTFYPSPELGQTGHCVVSSGLERIRFPRTDAVTHFSCTAAGPKNGIKPTGRRGDRSCGEELPDGLAKKHMIDVKKVKAGIYNTIVYCKANKDKLVEQVIDLILK